MSDLLKSSDNAKGYLAAAGLKKESWSDCQITPTAWVVKGVIPDEAVTVIWGASGSGKTYVTAHLCMCVMSGIPFLEAKAKVKKRGSVAYVAAEKVASVKRRFAAMKAVSPTFQKVLFENDSLDVYSGSIALLEEDPGSAFVNALVAQYASPDKEVREAMEGLDAALPLPPSVVVIDTLSAAFAGIEENGSQMATVIRRCNEISRRLKCAVVIIHHSGIDSTRERGHSSLRSNADQSIKVEGSSGTRTMEIVKVTDLATGDKFEFEVIGCASNVQDEDGGLIPVAFVQRAIFSPVPAQKIKPVSAVGLLAFQAYWLAWDNRGEKSVVDDELFKFHLNVHFGMYESKQRSKVIERGLGSCVSKKWLKLDGGLYTANVPRETVC